LIETQVKLLREKYISPWDQVREAAARSAVRGIVAAVKKDREPSEKGPEGSLALSRCAGTEERSGEVALCLTRPTSYLLAK
jgi:hypothetical protein